MMAIIEAKDISKSFGDFYALKNINLNIKAGEFFGCFGPNGAGKTTLLRILSGQLEPTKGTATVLGIDARKKPIEVKSAVGIVPEVESPPSYLTGREYLHFVGRVRKVKDLDKKIDFWLDFFELAEKEDVICKDLSKGMRQKLMLASAFIHEPKLLFLDEPFINLDPLYQRKAKDYLRNYTQNGGTVFMCTHILEIAEKICTEVAIINGGHILAKGSINELKDRESEDLERIFLRLVSGE
ncbi:MAG: ABC transporter ATP-binding protein [Methanomassiliicoccales archaeon]|nr:MAG: ABC transporter ATP-binding protein [Methanomassiliicoccales archaeon]